MSGLSIRQQRKVELTFNSMTFVAPLENYVPQFCIAAQHYSVRCERLFRWISLLSAVNGAAIGGHVRRFKMSKRPISAIDKRRGGWNAYGASLATREHRADLLANWLA